MGDTLLILTFVAALGCGLSAGALFAFSSFVMDGLRRLPAAQGIAAMQSINITAPTPAFMTALFGSAVACVALAVWALADWDDSYSPWLLAGAAAYLVGTIALTITYHVPRNDALARVDPDSPEASARWERYVAEWTRWNHVRTTAAIAAAGAFTGAIQVG
jgi:uncharacterized membrane protein